jgi:hypothetical protein
MRASLHRVAAIAAASLLPLKIRLSRLMAFGTRGAVRDLASAISARVCGVKPGFLPAPALAPPILISGVKVWKLGYFLPFGALARVVSRANPSLLDCNSGSASSARRKSAMASSRRPSAS